jgi:hypothetical protein
LLASPQALALELAIPRSITEEIDLFESIVVQEDSPAIHIKEEYVEPITGANKRFIKLFIGE